MIIESLQHILFPDDDSLANYWGLYYRGDRGRLTELNGEQVFCLGKYYFAEFNTYLNGLSFAKWKTYTSIEKVTLKLEFSGAADVTLCGYTLSKAGVPERKVLRKYRFDDASHKEVILEYPDNDEMMLSFEISAITEVVFYKGSYLGLFPEDSENPVELALTTTTFKKEEYITKNTRRMKEGLFDLYPEAADHIRMHVVDNGRTLDRTDLPDDEHFELHPNPNAGGAGGYARGMIECLHQKPEATHALLMDDDIMILPDSVYRTYQLLHFLKPEYKEHFIGGAMLILEDKNIQHEDMGCVINGGEFAAVKPHWNHFELRDNLLNEKEYNVKDTYQAWWYCCIPVPVIKKNGLPLPLFIRGDDVEYSLRCKAKIISMNGVCVWHMGFYGKFSASMNIYQEFRNLWIDQATTGILEDANMMERFRKNFRANLLKHDYASAEMGLRAFEDFMKGPRFIMQNRGEEIVRENGKLNEKLVPLEELPVKLKNMNEDPYWDLPRKPLSTLWYRATFNGHLFWPEKLMSDEPVMIPFDAGYTPGKMALHKTYVAVNTLEKKGCIRRLDRERFRNLEKRYYWDMAYYKKYGEKIKAAYREKREYLMSEEFWRKYLNLM